MKRRILIIFFMILCLSIVSCKKKIDDDTKYDIPILSIEKDIIEEGTNTKIIVSNYTNLEDFKIYSFPNNIVSISNNETITGLTEGEAIITITHKLDIRVTTSVIVTVIKPQIHYEQPIVSLDKTTLTLGETTYLRISNYPNLNDFNISINPKDNICIDEDGKITSLKTGTSSITLVHKLDSNISTTVNILINKPLPVITTEENMKVNGIYDFLINNNNDFTDYNITLPDNDGIKINNGYIHCYNEGTYEITVTDKEDISCSQKIQIVISKEDTSTIVLPEFNVPNPYAEVGNKISLRFKNGYTINDFDFITNIYDDRGNEQISFDNNYRIIGLKPCKETLYARLKKNHDIVVMLEFEITSIHPDIFVYRNTLFVNEISYLTVSNFDVTYEKNLDEFNITSSDESILIIENDTFKGVGVGTATITLTSKYNELVSSSIAINILTNDENMVSMKVIEPYNGVVARGEQFHLEIYNGVNISQDSSKYTFVSSDDEIIRVTDEGFITILNEGYGLVTAYEKGNPSNKYIVRFHIFGEPNVDYVARILHLAIGEKGYVERYDPETGQYVNDTKYNHWYNMDGPWCAMFVSWCWYHAGLSNNLLVKYCSCSAGKAWCESRGIFKYKNSYTPKSGDIVFFLSAGAGHTGIVIYCDNTYIYTIEGNASNRVDVWRWSLNDARITGYGTPKYPEYKGEKEDFSWIMGNQDNGKPWWNNVPEKQEML